MFNRYWVAAIALVIAAQTVPLYAQERPQPALQGEPEATGQNAGGGSPSTQQAGPEDSDSAPLLTAIQSIEAAIRELVAEEDKVAAEQRDALDQADLRAQESMALWAFWMFVASAFSVFLTGVGVLLIWRTLIYTRDAAQYAKVAADHAGAGVKEAKKATVAARDTVTVTRDLGMAQLRPYIFCKSASYTLTKESMDVQLELGNVGISPAGEVRIVGKGTINWIGGIRPRVISWGELESYGTDAQPIGPGGSITEEVYFFQKEPDEDSFGTLKLKDANTVELHIDVRWLDVFGVEGRYSAELSATIDATPRYPKRRRLTKGKLDLRSLDLKRIIEEEGDAPEG